MNAISGLSSTSGLAQIYTHAAVQAVRPVTSNAQRAELAQADRYEASSSRLAMPSVTYGRNGQGAPAAQAAVARADADGDGD